MTRICSHLLDYADHTQWLCLWPPMHPRVSARTYVQVRITGQNGATIRSVLEGQPLFMLKPGAPHVHISKVRLLGQLNIQGGELDLADCLIESEGQEARSSGGRALNTQDGEPLLSISDGHVILTRVVLQGHMSGAISVLAATLTLTECNIRGNHAPRAGAMHVSQGAMVRVELSNFTDNAADGNGGALMLEGGANVLMVACSIQGSRAQSGGAMHVDGNSTVQIERSNITHNSAVVSGGALHVDSGRIDLLDRTLLEHNTAPNGQGSSIYLTAQSSLRYTLPAPPARYLFIRQGETFELKPGAEDSAFPYLCPAGVVGGTSPGEQSGPGCSASCPAGSLCGPATVQPARCNRGHYCPRGTAVAIPCEAGRFSNSSSLASEEGCDECYLGHWCSQGSERAQPCKAGRYGASMGQTDSDCSGECLLGHFCAEGSISNTSGVCRKRCPHPSPAGTHGS